MTDQKIIKSALISVFDKSGLAEIVKELTKNQVTIYSTGGTETFIKNLGIDVIPVENITSFPEILGGRVKTLHPKIFGGILNRQNNADDQSQMELHQIPQIDLVIVDLYPFENTVASGANHYDIIEKIDIGGISLIRAGAKNYNDTVIIPSVKLYSQFLENYIANNGSTTLSQRQFYAGEAFKVSSKYDQAIAEYFIRKSDAQETQYPLRYGENPHQNAHFEGNLNEVFNKLHGKDLSYNNLLDIDAAIQLMNEFKNDRPTFGILKHNNACGFAQKDTVKDAYLAALAGDPTSAFGGILISNTTIDESAAEEINQLFCEVVIAPNFDNSALDILKSKKNRILLQWKKIDFPTRNVRSCLNGILVQDANTKTDAKDNLCAVTTKKPTDTEIDDLLFASKICKHTKSNTIVLVKNAQLCASGTGQTSRVDALKQAIEKANHFDFDLNNAVMASDAFFPFPDCVEIAHKAGITAVIQPGGSVNDQISIDYCDAHSMAMVMTGTRHFKH